MRIISLVENTTKSELKAKHGLSLYIETRLHKILFDLGSDDTLFNNEQIDRLYWWTVITKLMMNCHYLQ